jgi:S-adenosylmethionine:tRNA ribosyltransferase-isomerase
MHAEWFEIKKKTIESIVKAKKEKRRIIAVGTTSARVLETIFQNSKFKIQNSVGWTDIFIYPGYKFKAVDALLTNFHLPESTLLMLVSAFAGRVLIKKTYAQAIKKRYHFFSYGDAMLIE